ncbi:hypothetical protein M8C21_028213 [Ambrosia artemisiifolia]|uniref:Uncharacterized protein n=1 Tax=Ambrosia artemisiifolia TaxID=4212 RepID=A0AAD5GRB9_AMBAR|nr:hypothetical protein M8C21_028213 [Ambrosia artemisiifolia]
MMMKKKRLAGYVEATHRSSSRPLRPLRYSSSSSASSSSQRQMVSSKP